MDKQTKTDFYLILLWMLSSILNGISLLFAKGINDLVLDAILLVFTLSLLILYLIKIMFNK